MNVPNRLKDLVGAWLLGLMMMTSSAFCDTTTTILGGRSDSDSTASLPEAPREVLVAVLDDQIINPVTAQYVISLIKQAEARNIPLLLQLDTPGGLLQSTREMVKAIMSARVPVITFVGPEGSRAASAGVFITMASHVAAMAPSTNIGAAHPVGIGVTFRRKSDKSTTSTLPDRQPTTAEQVARRLSESNDPNAGESDVMGEKVMNDTLAWIEGIAKRRGRNADWARKSVEESVSITSTEAKNLNVIDMIASSPSDLLRQLDGRQVQLPQGVYTFRTKDVVVTQSEMTFREQILNILANPNIAYVLLLAGVLGLFYELANPGAFIPGIVGVICLLLAALGLKMLPTNFAGLALILLGIGLIVAEIKVTSYGLLTVAGALCLFFGSLTLIEREGPFTGVSLSFILPVVTAVVGLLVVLVSLVARAHARVPVIGNESFVGQLAEVSRDLVPAGKVFFDGSHWDALSTENAPAKSVVRIVAVQGLKLLVEPVRDEVPQKETEIS